MLYMVTFTINIPQMLYSIYTINGSYIRDNNEAQISELTTIYTNMQVPNWSPGCVFLWRESMNGICGLGFADWDLWIEK
jgi:hypothetical protein